jgi:hypothetical protein
MTIVVVDRLRLPESVDGRGGHAEFVVGRAGGPPDGVGAQGLVSVRIEFGRCLFSDRVGRGRLVLVGVVLVLRREAKRVLLAE